MHHVGGRGGALIVIKKSPPWAGRSARFGSVAIKQASRIDDLRSQGHCARYHVIRLTTTCIGGVLRAPPDTLIPVSFLKYAWTPYV